jgi:hypothetical protein
LLKSAQLILLFFRQIVQIVHVLPRVVMLVNMNLEIFAAFTKITSVQAANEAVIIVINVLGKILEMPNEKNYFFGRTRLSSD